MRIIDWNICYSGDTKEKIDYLKTLLTDDGVIIMQEVKPHAYEYIKKTLGEQYRAVYSLDYRKPGKFDSDARKLGVLILISSCYAVKDAGVIDRSPFPDRTAFATIEVDGREVKILALHSLTGCAYYRTKSVQYESVTEFVDNYCPDIVGIDANEPQFDHYDINKMKFFDNGPGAEIFFNEIIDLRLVDAYVKCNGVDSFVEGQPLIKSHNIHRKGAVRYDFLFINDDFNVNDCSYYYDEAVTAGSDHAVIVVNVADM